MKQSNFHREGYVNLIDHIRIYMLKYQVDIMSSLVTKSPEAPSLSWQYVTCHKPAQSRDKLPCIRRHLLILPEEYPLLFTIWTCSFYPAALLSRLYLVMSIKIVHKTQGTTDAGKDTWGYHVYLNAQFLSRDQSGGWWCGGVIRTCYIMFPTCENKYSNPTNKLPVVISSPRLTLVSSSRRQLSVSNVT